MQEQVRTAEMIAALSLATDLAIRLPLEHGLESTLVAMRLGERLGVDPETAMQTYYACLLFYVGCTADAEIAAELFGADLRDTSARRCSGPAPSRCAGWRSRSRCRSGRGRCEPLTSPGACPPRCGFAARTSPRSARSVRC